MLSDKIVGKEHVFLDKAIGVANWISHDSRRITVTIEFEAHFDAMESERTARGRSTAGRGGRRVQSLSPIESDHREVSSKLDHFGCRPAARGASSRIPPLL